MAKGGAGKSLLDWIKAAAWAFGIWLVLSTFVVQAYFIPSPSMETTLMVGDVLFVNKFLFGAEVPLLKAKLPAVREPARGDIVVFDSIEEDLKVVKRLIGLAGDTLEMRSGVVYRNGRRLEEPYAVNSEPEKSEDQLMRSRMRAWQVPHFAGPVPMGYEPDLHDWGPVVVPQDSLFVMGDNRDGSYDGRYWGFLPRVNVVGTPVLVYFSYDVQSLKSMAFLTEVRWHRLFSTPR